MAAPSPAAAAVVAAAAAARYSGQHALHPLLPGAAQLVASTSIGKIRPTWAPKAQDLLGTWEQLAPCMKYYTEFRKKTKASDVKRLQVFMNEKAQSELARFYLCCALRLRRQEVEDIGQDSERLLQMASKVAQEDVEPFFEACRKFVEDYNEDLHRKLDETTVWKEVEDSLFWHHSFRTAAPAEYARFQAALLPPSEQWPAPDDAEAVAKVLEDSARLMEDVSHPAAVAGCSVFQSFLEASSATVKGALRAALIDHGIIWGEVNYRPSEAPTPPPVSRKGGPREAVIE